MIPMKATSKMSQYQDKPDTPTTLCSTKSINTVIPILTGKVSLKLCCFFGNGTDSSVLVSFHRSTQFCSFKIKHFFLIHILSLICRFLHIHWHIKL